MITSPRDIFNLTAKQIVTMKVNGSKYFEVKIPTEDPIKVCTFLSREMRTGTQTWTQFQEIFGSRKPIYETLIMKPCSSQIGKIPVVIWALPQVAKQTLLAPDIEGSP